MREKLVVLLLVLCASTAFAKSFTPKHNTRASIKAYVESAAKYVAKHGADCAAFKSKAWMYGDYYIFVDGPDGKTLCHPNPAIVGKTAEEIVDANGKKVGVAIRETAAKKGGGWVEYVWPRPGTDKPVAKSTYAMQVKAPDGKMYVVGAGGYEVK